ncbi:DUF488 domain-containing protein [Amycolatopsis rhizosphaerae]|uniref:DUF488 domain-containing protein n=1 Tax=Amycolatopsis rhizosphaerae TaxID=2053003 RepID=A0A558BIQ0_9PSEU|nr:DUF488 domain-containing protein [Amycolatopsis rhizosphaerae]TVT36400.1 DUF488 domain-containing protein [Amycolatopsis rhizosphaerae]
MSTVSSCHAPFGVGYEGLDLDGFVASLIDADADVLVDVRLTPISRKRGFSKRALGEAIEAAGMTYLHLPSLGNPKVNRQGFGGSNVELNHARAVYARLISEKPESQAALAELAEVARYQRVAVMCFEADQNRCHRHVVLAELQRRATVEMVTA